MGSNLITLFVNRHIKKIVSLVLLCLISNNLVLAQAPEKINYQAVARDLSGTPLSNQSLTITYEIRQGTANGIVSYSEIHNGVTTNQFGLFTAEIGGGTPLIGTFSGITWGANIHYLAVFVDGDLMGSSQLLSVPYALYSKESGNASQGLPGKNSLSQVAIELPGINCQFGGTKVEVGLDDNSNNFLDSAEIDDTYYVCNGDTTPSGIAFWTLDATTNAIYNNNLSGVGNVGIGTSGILTPRHKLTVVSQDTVFASFNGSNSAGAFLLLNNSNLISPLGIMLSNNQDTSALISINPNNKILSFINEINNGKIEIVTEDLITLRSRFIRNLVDTLTFSNTTNSTYTNNKGLFDTDSLRVGGANSTNNNFVLTNNGNGNATWTDPASILPVLPWTRTGTTIHETFVGDNVGIGTVNATNKLHIVGSTANEVVKIENTNSAASSSMLFSDNLGNDKLTIGYANAGFSLYNSNSFINSNSNFLISTQHTERIRIDTSGNIGIGTTSPIARLEVDSGALGNIQLFPNTASTNPILINTLGAGNKSIQLKHQNGIDMDFGSDGTGGIIGTTSNHNLNFISGNTINATLTNAGNMGIDNLAPLTKLDVNGQITMRSGATAGYIPISNSIGTMTWTDPASILPVLPWTRTGNSLYPTFLQDSVGLATTSPEAKLHLLAGPLLLNYKMLQIGHAAQPNSEWLFEIDPTSKMNLSNELFGSLLTFDSNGGGRIGVNVAIPTAKFDLSYTELLPPNTNTALKIQNINSLGSFRNGIQTIVNGLNMNGLNKGIEAIAGGAFGIGSNYALHAYTIGLTGNNFAGYFGNGNLNSGRVYIQDDLGIGTTTPAAKLDVNGTFKLGTQGTTNSKLITGQTIFTTGLISPLTTLINSVSIPGAVFGDGIIVTMETNVNGIIISSAVINAAGGLEVRFFNTTSLPIVAPPVKVSYMVFK